MNEEEFNSIVSKIVIEHLNGVLGSNIIQVMNYYLNQYQISLSDIAREPAKVSDILYKIFGECTKILVIESIKSAYRRFNLIPNESDCSDLERGIERLRSLVVGTISV